MLYDIGKFKSKFKFILKIYGHGNYYLIDYDIVLLEQVQFLPQSLNFFNKLYINMQRICLGFYHSYTTDFKNLPKSELQ